MRGQKEQKLNLNRQTTSAVRKAPAWRRACAVYLSKPQTTTTQTLIHWLWPQTQQQCCFLTVFKLRDHQTFSTGAKAGARIWDASKEPLWNYYHLSVTESSSQTGLNPEKPWSIRIVMQTSAMKWRELLNFSSSLSGCSSCLPQMCCLCFLSFAFASHELNQNLLILRLMKLASENQPVWCQHLFFTLFVRWISSYLTLCFPLHRS